MTCFSLVSANERWRTQVSSKKLVQVFRTSASTLPEEMDRKSSSSYIFSANNISEMRRAMRLVIQKQKSQMQLHGSERNQRSKNYLTGDLCFQVRNNLIISFIKLIPLLRGIVKTCFSRSQGCTNLNNTSQIRTC